MSSCSDPGHLGAGEDVPHLRPIQPDRGAGEAGGRTGSMSDSRSQFQLQRCRNTCTVAATGAAGAAGAAGGVFDWSCSRVTGPAGPAAQLLPHKPAPATQLAAQAKRWAAWLEGNVTQAELAGESCLQNATHGSRMCLLSRCDALLPPAFPTGRYPALSVAQITPRVVTSSSCVPPHCRREEGQCHSGCP